MDRYDIVIVGAGLAGLQYARLLGPMGMKVLLADSKNSVSEKVHTTGIFVRKTLEDFDLPADCLGPPIRRVSLYSPSLRRIDIDSPMDEFRVGRMAELYELWLLDATDSGVDWRSGSRLIGIETRGADSLITLECGRTQTRVLTRFVIGADGATSRVAQALGLSRNRDWIVGVEDVYHGVPLAGEPRFHCFLDPRIAPGYLAWVVNDGHEAHIGVGGYANRFHPAAALESFKSRLDGIADVTAATFIERRGGRIPVGGVLPRIANRWGLLVGDAAGTVSPLTAGGLDPCLRLSSLAAVIAADYVTTGDPRILDGYDGRRFRSQFGSRLLLRRMLNLVRTPFEMELAFCFLKAAPFRELTRKVFFGRGSFPDVSVSHSPTILTVPEARFL